MARLSGRLTPEGIPYAICSLCKQEKLPWELGNNSWCKPCLNKKAKISRDRSTATHICKCGRTTSPYKTKCNSCLWAAAPKRYVEHHKAIYNIFLVQYALGLCQYPVSRKIDWSNPADRKWLFWATISRKVLKTRTLNQLRKGTRPMPPLYQIYGPIQPPGVPLGTCYNPETVKRRKQKK